MKNKRLVVIASLLVFAAALPVLAQPPQTGDAALPGGAVQSGLAQPPQPGSVELPITRIVLFSSGVGYFQREGQVDGNAHIDLRFHTQDINDLLKSLVLQDTGGGQISTVTYDNRDPIDKTLKSFAINLTNNPSLGDLLDQVRGERIELISYGEHGREGQPVSLTGVIVGVQKEKKPVGKDQVVETERLNLLTSDGLQSVALGQVQRIRFLKPELEQEFRKALEVLATGHDKQKKTVTFNFLGQGKRLVRVGYVTENPIWKTSYRLSLDKENKAFLQGWAIVENTTDEDWNQVSLGLISGRPISFQMDLYEPLFVPRPTVEPELFASLRPQTYNENLMEKQSGMARGTNPYLNLNRASTAAEAPRAKGRRAGTSLGLEREQVGGALLKADADKAKDLDFRQGVASAAAGKELGEYFQYHLEQPVSLPRQKSALLPIVNAPVEAAKVSIYNEAVLAKYPLLGLRFKNTTGMHLMQGPLTVFENNSYAGDARITDVQPNETRLVSYAIDLGTEVAPENKNAHADLVAVKIYKGILHSTYKQRQTKLYTVKNRSEHPRVVLIEHPYRADWKLVQPDKPTERTRDMYRFEVTVKPGETVKEEVVEENTRLDQIALTNSADEAVRFFLRAKIASPKVKAALQEALALKAKFAETFHEIEQEEKALQVFDKEQGRMRSNMAQLPQTSEVYKRYLKKFDEQETEIETRRGQITKLQKIAEEQRKNYENFLLNLNVE
jgi:hypothetical protein